MVDQHLIRPPQVGPTPALDELLCRVASGDDLSFRAFYDQLADKVLGIASMVLHDVSQAEEVTQEVFVELWRTAPRYAPEKGGVTGWAMTLAHRRAVDRVRSAEASRQREHSATFEASSSRPFDQVVEDVLEDDERQRVVLCLGQLSDLQREAVYLTYYEGRTIQQIAEAGQLSTNTVKSRLRSALRRLRDCLEDMDRQGPVLGHSGEPCGFRHISRRVEQTVRPRATDDR